MLDYIIDRRKILPLAPSKGGNEKDILFFKNSNKVNLLKITIKHEGHLMFH